MTSYSQTSRRSFLSSIAILSAGAAFGSAADLLPMEKSIPDLQDQWNSFCKQHGGEILNKEVHLNLNAHINPCSGHFHKGDRVVYFPHANILAQPTWIYWSKQSKKPSDVVIAFFKNDPGYKKILRINRFELEAMCVLFSGMEEKKWIPIRNDADPFHAFIENAGWKLKVKTRFTRSQNAQILTTLSKKEIVIEKKLFYNIKLI